jgi:hypothetical protein
MPTLTTYFATVNSVNNAFLYPAVGGQVVSPTTNWPAGNLWSWVELIPSRPTPHNPAIVVNPISLQASNDAFRCTYDQDSANYNPPQSTWTIPTNPAQRTFTDTLILSNLAVKPNSSWTITGVTITIRKAGEGSPYTAGTTFAQVDDAFFTAQVFPTVTSRGTTSSRGEKVGLWPDTLTDFVYDLSTLYPAITLQNIVYRPSTWQNILTNIRFAARILLSNTAKESYNWGLDSVLITFTYILPSITPYPIAGVLMSNFVHTLRSQPVTINPYSVKTIEAVNLQIPAPGTKIAPVSNIRPFTQLTQEIIGRHRLNPGNVNITNYPIKTIETSGTNRITAIVNLIDRSIVSLEKPGFHRLNAQANINPFAIQTIENKLNYSPVILPDDTGYPIPSIRTNANITPRPIQAIEQLGLHTLYSQAYIYPYPQATEEESGYHSIRTQAFINPYGINNDEKLGLHTLYSQAFIIPYPINTVEKTGLHRLNSEAFIRPYSKTTEEILGLHRLLYAGFIYPYSIISIEYGGLHELLREVRTISFLNEVHYPTYEMGYYDCVAISRDVNNDPYYNMSFASLNADYMFSINNMNLSYKQNSNFEKRLAGEGASPTTFKIDKREFSFDFTMPVKIESWGDVDPSFAALYDYCIQGYKGSTNNFVGRILASNMNAAIGITNRFSIDNVSDFISLGTGYEAYIRSDDNTETTETITVLSIDKETKTIVFAPSTSYSHTPYKSYVWASTTNPATNREPSFSLFSAKEGLFSGCLVDSITLRIVPGENIVANINIKFTDLDRKYQKNFFNNFDTIMSNINDRKPNYLLNSSLVTVSNSQSSTSNFTFNLGDAKTSKLFYGFQEYDLRDFEITEMTIDIKNNLEPVYSLNSKSSDNTENFNKNLQPYAYYSNGRSISGTIKYNSPMKPWLLAERLSGPSNINKSGILFNFGPFTLELPQIAWTPESTNSNVDSVQNKSISWSVVVDSLSYDPYPTPTGEL